jgi:orotidine-5'-phosphate decarboxylase
MTAAEASAIKQRLIVALDLADPAKATTLATLLAPEVGMFKVGKQLFVNAGPNIVRTIHDLGGEVFLDLKFHDIPNTVAAAAVEATRLGVKLFNVHISGGREMMRQTAAAVEEVCGKEGLRRPAVLGVTVLTSLDGSDLEALGIQGGVPAQVVRLAGVAQEAGLAGVVCSAQEVPEIRRACGESFMMVTPGIRPAGQQAGDQKRVMTPGDAVRAGIDYIVVGRPITAAADPVAAARSVVAEMASVLL